MVKRGKGFLFDDNELPTKLMELKDKRTINKQILKGIGTITSDKENTVPFGSWIYKSQLYPSDVDLVEITAKCCDLETVIPYFVKKTKKVVKKIQETRGAYFGDIKAGFDYAFKINIGDLTYNKIGNSKITGYNAEHIKHEYLKLRELDIIDNKELKKLNDLTPNNIDNAGFETLYDTLREKFLLRWTPSEILKGKKSLSGNRIITLTEAIQMPTMTKIDMIMLVNERFIEFSNVLVYVLKDEKGNETVLNFANKQDKLELIEDLKYEVQKYAYSIKNFKPFKMVKRIWSIARLTKDKPMVKKLTGLMQTDLGRLSQIVSEIETLLLILSNVKSPPLSAMLEQIDNFKYRMSNVFEIPIDIDYIINTVDKITKTKLKTTQNKKLAITKLKDMKKYIMKFINEITLLQLKKLGLLPIPANYLPPDYETRYEEDLEGGIIDYPNYYEKKVKPIGYFDDINGGCDTPWSPNCPSSLVKSKLYKGDGIATRIYQKLANAYRRVKCNPNARQLKDGELHPYCWNFCGPNTKIELDEVRNHVPYDNIDNVCRTHDIDYMESNNKPNKAQLIRQADNKMLASLEPYKNEPYFNLAKYAIKGKVTAENLLPNLIKRKFGEHYGEN